MGGGGDSAFTYKLLLIAVAVTFLLPIFISTFATTEDADPRTEELLGEALEGYNRFTGGTQALTNESIWVLNGIYRPYLGAGGNYLYTSDGWLAGSVITNYSPSQYTGNEKYQVTRNNENFYQYTGNTYDGHTTGDMYTSVTMDVNEKSNIFFTTNNKINDGSYFYYQYSGLRYAFVPLTSTYSYDGEGNLIESNPSTSSLSLIWYDYVGNSGISGNLVVSNDKGVAYLSSQDIIEAFDPTVNTAKFTLYFSGIPMNIYIRIDPAHTSLNQSIEYCYNMGYWSVMVTSPSVDVRDYTSADNSFNVYSVFDTAIDLLTFDLGDYNLTPTSATVASIAFVLPLYLALIVVGLNHYPVLIVAGILAVIQGWSSGWFGGLL